MKISATIRTIATVATMAMLLGAFYAVPAEAKKKKKKKPKVEACAPYAPSEWGAEAETVVVTDEATAEAPIAVELEVPAGAGSTSPNGPDEGDGAASHVFVNVQVDSAAPTSGLYATIAYSPPVLDYDLWIRNNEGIGVAYSAGYLPGVPFFDGTGNGGHTGTGTENVEGLTTSDCGGYLVDVAGATTPGGAVELTLWLGEATYAPE